MKELDKHTVYELSHLTAFKNFSKRELKQLVQDADRIYLQQGDVLFHQGEESDSAFILISGRLSAVLDWGEENPSYLGMVKPGDFVGEMGVIMDDTRSCAIVAQKECSLLRIEKQVFLKKMQKNLALVTLINHLLSVRLKKTIRKIHNRDMPRTIAFVPASESIKMDEIVLQLKQALRESDLNYFVVDYAEVEKKMGAEYTDMNINNWLEEIEATYDFVFFIATNMDKHWFDYVLYKTERVVVIADAVKNSWGPEIKHFLQAKPLGFSIKEIVLIHPSENTPITHTDRVLPQGFHGRFHHVYIDETKDYQRLLRFITGSAVGVVLSGGGTRGWVHVGALLALQDHGVCIDAVCGTSSGAMIASFFLTSNSKEEFIKHAGSLFNVGEKSINWYDYTWPKVSLLSGKAQYTKLLNIFGEKRIEDLKIPFMAIASNLSKAEQIIIRKDLISKAIRTTCSMPGIVPPMVQEGDLIVDGGILNNLPTDIMDNYLENNGLIIAVDLSITEIRDTFQFPPMLTIKDYFRNRFRKKPKKFRLPSMSNIIMQSITLGSSQLMHINKNLADIFIQPPLIGSGMLVNPDYKKLMDIGYTETMKRLKAWEKEQGITLKTFASSLKMPLNDKQS
jgi:predicted acylesterase/phospholipase RssA/CRP-like cAMP-binding protein